MDEDACFSLKNEGFNYSYQPYRVNTESSSSPTTSEQWEFSNSSPDSPTSTIKLNSSNCRIIKFVEVENTNKRTENQLHFDNRDHCVLRENLFEKVEYEPDQRYEFQNNHLTEHEKFEGIKQTNNGEIIQDDGVDNDFDENVRTHNIRNIDNSELSELDFYYGKVDFLGYDSEYDDFKNNEEQANCIACTLSEIRSDFGTVRGLQSRVANIIRQFNNKETDDNFLHTCHIGLKPEFRKVIIYTTSLGVIRKTRSECLYVRQVFRILMVKTEERDICCLENRKLFEKQFKGLVPPQVIINGEHVGGRDQIEALLETGQIYNLVRYIDKVAYSLQSCMNCAGLSYTNCPHCSGSRHSKSLRFTRQLFRLNCTFCTDGLIRCMECLDTLN